MGTFLNMFLISALMLTYAAAEREYYFPGMLFSWEDARGHCQRCFTDLVTVTPENSQLIARKLNTDHWIGLRKNSNSSDNSSMTWSWWANGDPLFFQNWYPGWPVFKTPPPKIDCCSCSCTCPVKPTNRPMTSQPMTTHSSGLSTFDTEELTDSSTLFTNDLTQSDGFTSNDFTNSNIQTELNNSDPENTTDFQYTLEPENTTELNNSDPENTTEFYTSDPENTTKFNTSDPENTTDFQYTLDPENTTELNNSDPENTTEFYTSDSENTTGFYTSDPENTTELNNSDPENITEFYTSDPENTTNILELHNSSTVDQVELSISNIEYTEINTTDSANVTLTTLSDRSGINVTSATSSWSTTSTATTSQSDSSYTTSASFTETEATCRRIPTPLVLETENYIEESCVAMLRHGPWIEKECYELLPFICFEDRFFGEVIVTNVTFTKATLSWEQGPGDISHYRLEVKGDVYREFNLSTLTKNLVNLTAGTQFKVQVFPVKCERDINPQNATFFTVPNKVINLTVTSVTETSVTLSWEKPDGNLDFYRIKSETHTIKQSGKLNTAKIDDLTPGRLYTFNVSTGVRDESKWSEESEVTTNTKPAKVSKLWASNNTDKSVLLSWSPPEGSFTGFRVTVNANSASEYIVEENVRSLLVNMTPGTKIKLIVTTLANYTTEQGYIPIVQESDMEAIETYTAPGEIGNLNVTSTQSEISAKWSAAVGSDVKYKAKLVLDGTREEIEETVSDTKVTFTNLKNSASYTLEINAFSGNFSGPSKNASIYTTPKKPEDVKKKSSTSDSITFEWKAPQNSSEPTYSVKLTSDFWDYTKKNTTKETTYEFKDLKSGSNYSFEIYTQSGNDTSGKVQCFGNTDPDKVEIFLSVLCSSTGDQHCEESNMANQMNDELRKYFTKTLQDNVHWEISNEIL